TPTVSTTVGILEPYSARPRGEEAAGFGDVSVTTQVLGYRRHELYSERILEQIELDLPPRTFRTEGLWFALPPGAALQLARLGHDILGATHAIEHADISIAPLRVMCDRWDLGGASHPAHPELQRLPAVFLHDSQPGGVGIAAR